MSVTNYNYTIHMADGDFKVNTFEKPATVTLCKCSNNSTKGVVISKSSTKNHITISPDKDEDIPKVLIHDGKDYVSFIIVKRNKVNDLCFKYEDGTWYMQR